MTRADRFASLYEKHTRFVPVDPQGYFISPDAYAGERWMLIERSNGPESYTMTTEWTTPAECLAYLHESGYYFGGEYADGWWSVLALYDLDSGDTYRIGRNGQFAKQ
jgi:hypothetical protein